MPARAPLTSARNPQLRLTQMLLAGARARRRQGLVVLEGRRLIEDALGQGQRPQFILHQPDVTPPPADAPRIPVDATLMRGLGDTQRPQGLLAVFPRPPDSLPPGAQFALLLDGLRNPGNLGAIMRSAAAAGVDCVLLAPGCVDPWHPRCLRAGMGAHFRLALAELEAPRIGAYTQDMQVLLADGAGELPYDQVAWQRPTALIIGGEAHGASREIASLGHARVRIPMAAADFSLNAAMAASVLLFEMRRQRQA